MQRKENVTLHDYRKHQHVATNTSIPVFCLLLCLACLHWHLKINFVGGQVNQQSGAISVHWI